MTGREISVSRVMWGKSEKKSQVVYEKREREKDSNESERSPTAVIAQPWMDGQGREKEKENN